jgi:HD superfamily phosphodiesterase
MNLLAQKVYEANEGRYITAENPLRSHGPDHHLRVYHYALELARKMNLVYDADILAGAALLHDMAAYYPEKSGEAYHDFDHKIAAEILAEIDFPESKTEAVLYAIAHHGSDAKYKDIAEPVEVALLRDADKLDVFGPIGVARIIMVRTLKGDTLDEIVADFYTHGHLERKWQSITYDEAREIAKADYGYSQHFFAELTSKLQSSRSSKAYSR